MSNPYWNNDFWQFFGTLGKRLFTGGSQLAPDEIQVLVLSFVAISCAALGPFLVLRRMAMLANSISHTVLLGLAFSYLLAFQGLSHLLIGSIVAALLTAFCTSALTRFFRLQEDASIGLVFTTLFSLGVLAVTLCLRDAHLCAEIVMGNADALSKEDLMLSLGLTVLNGAVFALFFRPLQFMTFDRANAASLGIRCARFDFLLLFLTAFSCVGAFRAVGVLVVLSFLVGPFLITRLFSHSLKALLFLGPAIGMAVSLLSVALSRHILSLYDLPLSTGGIVALLMAVFYILALAIQKIRYEKDFASR